MGRGDAAVLGYDDLNENGVMTTHKCHGSKHEHHVPCVPGSLRFGAHAGYSGLRRLAATLAGTTSWRLYARVNRPVPAVNERSVIA